MIAPAGVCTTSVAKPIADIAIPMLAASHLCEANRKIAR